MASRNGSATVAPKVPRMNVRRERCFFVMIMAAPSLFDLSLILIVQRYWVPAGPPATSAGSNLVRIWNGALSTIPMTIEDSR